MVADMRPRFVACRCGEAGSLISVRLRGGQELIGMENIISALSPLVTGLA